MKMSELDRKCEGMEEGNNPKLFIGVSQLRGVYLY